MSMATEATDVRSDAARGLTLGGGLLLMAIVTGRALLFDFLDPSPENSIVTAMTCLLILVALARAALLGALFLPPARVLLPLAFLCLLGLLATVFAFHRWPAELELIAWATHVGVFLASYTLFAGGETAAQTRSLLLGAVIATGAVAGLFGIVQRAVVLPELGRELVSTPEGRRLLSIPGAIGLVEAKQAFSTFLNPNVFSGYIALVLPVAVGAAISFWEDRRWKALAAAGTSCVALGIGLVLTGSLGGFVATGAGLVVASFPAWKGLIRPLLASTWRRRIALGAAAVVIMLAVWIVSKSASIRVRLEYWRATCAMIAEHPMGVGLGGFSDFYPRYKTPAGWETREAHNVYLGLAAEAGLAALAALALLAWGFGKGLLNARRDASVSEHASEEDPPLRWLGLAGGVSGILAAYVVGDATGLGMKASSVAEVFGGAGHGILGLSHLAFPFVWCAIFWTCSRTGQVGPAQRDWLAYSILGALAGLAVHGLVEFDFRVKSIMLTASALGAALLAWRGEAPLTVKLDGSRLAAVGVAGLVFVGILVWRGSMRTVGLWERAALARVESDRATTLERAVWKCQGWLSRPQGTAPPESLLRALDELASDGAISMEAALTRSALVSGEGGARSAAKTFIQRAQEEASLSLVRAWRSTVKYLEIEPGDERVCLELLSLYERLLPRARAQKGPLLPHELESTVERALEALAELSLGSFSAHLALGQFHASKGRLPQAAAALGRAAARYPLRPELWLLLGDARIFFDGPSALQAYARAIEVNRIVEDENTTLFARLWLSPPRRPTSGDLAARLDYLEGRSGLSAEISFRKGLMLAEIGGFAEAAAEFKRALEMRQGESQFAAFRALALEMEWARTGSADSRKEADSAWQTFRALQAEGGPRRLNDFAAQLIELRKAGLHAAARGRAREEP